jgi:hypothetical protein
MKTFLIKKLCFFFVLAAIGLTAAPRFSNTAHASLSADRLGFAYAAYGSNFTFQSLRLGRNQIEAGLFPFGLGVGYLQRPWSHGGYFGIGLSQVMGLGDLGPYASAGYERRLFSVLGLRAELISAVSYSGRSASFALIGATLRY